MGHDVDQQVTEFDLELSDGRVLHAYDLGAEDQDDSLPVFWFHGTPNIGSPPRPLFQAAVCFGLRWVSYDRPNYGGSSSHRARTVGSSAAEVSAVADALGIDQFAVLGHSGGSPHALACAALLPDRVAGVVSVAGLAPFNAAGFDWFAGMATSSAAELRAAVEGREALAKYLEAAQFEPEMFTPADHAALGGPWSWLLDVVGPAVAAGPGGQIDDDLAFVGPWGFDPAEVTAPALFCTARGIALFPVLIANGSRRAARTQNSGCFRRMDTSPFWARHRRLWSGFGRTPLSTGRIKEGRGG